jgi:hypothetical protein
MTALVDRQQLAVAVRLRKDPVTRVVGVKKSGLAVPSTWLR